jgi:TonB family protein
LAKLQYFCNITRFKQQAMKDDSKKNYIPPPQFEGGEAGMDQFVQQHLVYPAAALEKGVEGTVTLRYSIDPRGRVTQVKVVRGIGSGCDEEAVRVLSLMKFRVHKHWKFSVTHHNSIMIHFRLPSNPIKTEPVPSAEMQIQYNIIPSSKEPEPSNSGGYNYTIEY